MPVNPLPNWHQTGAAAWVRSVLIAEARKVLRRAREQ
jgi:hypothetical protein